MYALFGCAMGQWSNKLASRKPGPSFLARLEMPLILFVLDPHSIYRRGLAASLGTLEEVDRVHEADCIRDAWQHPALATAGVVILDTEIDGGLEFIGAVTESYGARVIACTAKAGEDSVLAAMQAGAVGFLCKETLVPDALAAAVRAAHHGAGVMAPDLLATLLKGLSPESVDGRGPISRLTAREQQVLSLIADGHPTREVAQQLCYSERTVKNVLHDIVTKFNARSRSQAVAYAVREGLI